MQPVDLDILVRRAARAGAGGAATYDPRHLEIRLQDGAWTAFSPPDDAAWAEDDQARLRGDAEAGRRQGARLAERLEQAGWSASAPRLLRAIASGQPVRVRVRAAAAELLSLPWTWLPLTAGGEPIHSQPAIAVLLGWEGGAATPRSAVSHRASVRGAERLCLATAGDPLASDPLVRLVAASAAAGGRPFEGARDRIDRVSVEALDHHLRAEAQHQRPVAALHLQAPLRPGPDGAPRLGLRGPDGAESPVSAPRLRELWLRHAGALRLLVCLPVGGAPLDATPLALAAHRAGVEVVVGARRPLSAAGAVAFSRVFYDAALSRSRSVEEALGETQDAMRREGLAQDADALLLCAHTATDHRPLATRPWPGLAPYSRHQAPFFAGRDRDIERVVEAVAALEDGGRPPVLILSAARGSGLRSLVHAGVVPRLLEERGGELVLTRPPDRPPAWGGPRVVVAEGLDELFFGPLSPSQRSGWAAHLRRLADPSGEVVVLLLVPSELVARCGELAIDDLGTRLDALLTQQAHHLMLPQPGPRAMQQMIEAPARAAGLRLEDGLAARIVVDLAHAASPLPRLGAALAGLQEMRVGAVLTHSAYERLGGAGGAVGRRAESALLELPTAQHALARDLLLALVERRPGEAARRRSRSLAELAQAAAAPQAQVDAVVGTLEDHGLLVRRGVGDDARVRLVADAVVSGWPRLQRWLEEQHAAPAPPAAGRGQGRGLGRLWWLAAAALLAPALIGLGSAWAGREQAQAVLQHAVEDPRTDPTVAAVQLRQIREPDDPDAWASAARQALAEPVASAVFGPWEAPVGAVRFRADGRAALARVGDQLHLLDPATGLSRAVPLDRAVLAGVPAPDGAALLAIDRGGTMWRWDPSRAPAPLFSPEEPGPVVAAFSPSGDVGLVVTAARWTLLDPRGAVLDTGPVPLDGEVPRVAAVADGGLRHVIAGQTGSVLFWSAGQEEPSRFRHPGVRRLLLNTGGTHLASLGDGLLRLTDLTRGTGVSRTPSTVRVDAAAFDSQGAWLTVDYTDLDEGAHRTRRLRVDQRSSQTEGDALDAAATSLVVSGPLARSWRGLPDGRVEERDLETGALLRTLRGHRGRVHLLQPSPDARWLATSGGDGTLRFWSVADGPGGVAAVGGSPEALRAALWQATNACAGLDEAGPEAWCACERCNDREPEACEGVPGGLKGLLASVSGDSECAL